MTKLRRRIAYGAAAVVSLLMVATAAVIARPTSCIPLPKETRTAAMELRRAAETWRGWHASDVCPTAELLKHDGMIDVASKVTDAWGAPFVIVCTSEETTVISRGPDGYLGNADDIRVPEGAIAQDADAAPK
jgi:hypothetical protein